MVLTSTSTTEMSEERQATSTDSVILGQRSKVEVTVWWKHK